jgi:hypothetical protein
MPESRPAKRYPAKPVPLIFSHYRPVDVAGAVEARLLNHSATALPFCSLLHVASFSSDKRQQDDEF